MSFPKSTPDRINELRFRNQLSPRNEASMLGVVSPPRSATRLPQTTNPQDSRGSLMRRFTTDSGRAPLLPSAISQRNDQDVQDYGPSTYHKVQLLEKKKHEYELLREQRRRFEADLQLLDIQQRRDEQELVQMQEDLGRSSNTDQGHQSEPTTPPDYNESNSGFPSVFSQTNRYSISSLTSPRGLLNLTGRSGSKVTSPSSGTLQSRLLIDDNVISQSISDMRKSIEEDDKAEAVRQDPTSHRSTRALNRYSMPVTKTRSGQREITLDQANTARFLFGEEEAPSSSGTNDFLQVNANGENFPILVRREDYPGSLSASSAALDLALSQPPKPEGNNTWSSFTGGHRVSRSQHGIPLNIAQSNGSNPVSKPIAAESSNKVRPSYRHSLDMKYRQGFDLQLENVSQVATSTNNQLANPSSLQASFSTNDIPVTRNINKGANTTISGGSTHSKYFHNHKSSLGCIPQGVVNNILNHEMNPVENTGLRENPNTGFPSIQSALHASAPPFGPSLTPNTNFTSLPIPMSPNSQQSYYGMQMMMSGMQNMTIAQPSYSSNPYTYASNHSFTPTRPQQSSSRETPMRILPNRRQNDGDPMNKFANVSLDSLRGEIYALCKDQHGCRYLQKKLEERNPDEIHQIWLESNQHVIEFMTDPFGNYLCQKLLEYCNDEERTVLIENASHDLVRIALNQHGTRALQKMIEHITTKSQIDTIINALRYRVVELIQDLNGNHVIQKCLNKLSSQDSQFIFDAVGKHCVDVGTHRHGCCVLQRCIDHADGEQKAWLIRQISNNSCALVQDPFGNYVVQYILDLNEPIFTEPLISTFKGRISQLSRQKFSSNVMEKCLRCAHDLTQDALIEELLQPSQLERLLRDSFANYVIQTALDHANPGSKARLIEAIRPHLPAIRNTPYGRRIQAKIIGNEGRTETNTNDLQKLANDLTEPSQNPLRHSRVGSTATSNNFVASVGGSFINSYSESGKNTSSVTSNRTLQLTGSLQSSEQLVSSSGESLITHSYPLGSSVQNAESNWL